MRKEIFNEKILNKYDVIYYLCDTCGLLQTQEPFWMNEAYSNAISDLDTGILERNNRIAQLLVVLLQFIGNKQKKYIDVGGGYGILTRLMRDRGYDFYWTDKYATNLFSKGFEAAGDLNDVNGVMAFEVLEHVYDPIAFISEYFIKYQTKTLIFSTLTYRGAVPPKDWWYYTFFTGQHISFFRQKTLARLADKLGTHYYKINEEYHLFTDKKISRWKLVFVRNKVFSLFLNIILKRFSRNTSKTITDMEEIKKRLMAK